MTVVDPIQVTRAGRTSGLGHALVCSGYLVEDGKVLLVHHNRFDKWVPPGGHIESGDTFANAARREFLEETGLEVEVLSTGPRLVSDANATPEPCPFYVDIEREGFAIPALVQFFYVRRTGSSRLTPQLSEVHDAKWFDADELASLPTFEQVRATAAWAIEHHPDSRVSK